MQKKRIWLYAGTWTTSGEGGIGIYRYDEETGETKYIKTVREDVVAGLTVADREKGILYTLDERANNPDIGEKAGGGGRVFAFRIDPETGDLTEINHQSSLGVMPAYLSWDSGKPEKGGSRGLITCNHSSGESVTKVVRDMTGRISLERQFSDTTVVHYPLRPDGSIGEPDDVVVTPPEPGPGTPSPLGKRAEEAGHGRDGPASAGNVHEDRRDAPLQCFPSVSSAGLCELRVQSVYIHFEVRGKRFPGNGGQGGHRAAGKRGGKLFAFRSLPVTGRKVPLHAVPLDGPGRDLFRGSGKRFPGSGGVAGTFREGAPGHVLLPGRAFPSCGCHEVR